MKQIKFSFTGADGEDLGSFTLDPLAHIRLMEELKDREQTAVEYVREILRDT